jgi:hypothetical protein
VKSLSKMMHASVKYKMLVYASIFFPSFTLHSDRTTSRDYCAAALRIFEESNRTNMQLLRRIQQLENLQGIDGEFLLQGKFFAIIRCALFIFIANLQKV